MLKWPIPTYYKCEWLFDTIEISNKWNEILVKKPAQFNEGDSESYERDHRDFPKRETIPESLYNVPNYWSKATEPSTSPDKTEREDSERL